MSLHTRSEPPASEREQGSALTSDSSAERRFGGALLDRRATRKPTIYPLLRRLATRRADALDYFERDHLAAAYGQELARNRLTSRMIVDLLRRHRDFLQVMAEGRVLSMDGRSEHTWDSDDQRRSAIEILMMRGVTGRTAEEDAVLAELRAGGKVPWGSPLYEEAGERLYSERRIKAGLRRCIYVGERARWREQHAEFARELGEDFEEISDKAREARVDKWMSLARRWQTHSPSGFDARAFEERLLDGRQS